MIQKINSKYAIVLLGIIMVEIIILFMYFFPTTAKTYPPFTYRKQGEDAYDRWIKRIKEEELSKNSKSVKLPGTHDNYFRSAGLINVWDLDSSIKVNLKYSSVDNFTKTDWYADLDDAYLQKDVALMLANANKLLKSKYPYYSIIIYDAVRPLSVQKKLWDSLSIQNKEKYLSSPYNGGSLHNYGAAVDVGIIDNNGFEIDMGTPFDFFGELGYPSKEKEMYAAGKLTYRQLENRKLLRAVMYSSGFTGIPTEWWHFNAISREQAAVKYTLIN